MIDLDWTFFAQLVNFLIILTVLNLILFRPIRGIIKKRAEVMGEKLGSIEAFTAQAESKLENYKASLSGARVEAQQMRVSLKAEGAGVEAVRLECWRGRDGVPVAVLPPASTIPSRRSRVRKSMVLSIITVPIRFSKGISSFLPRVAQRVTSPSLGNMMLARYPVNSAWYVLVREGL